MTEQKKNDQYEVEGLSKDSIVIPKGYDFVLVKVGEQDHVESNCPQCGGASLHTSPACVYKLVT